MSIYTPGQAAKLLSIPDSTVRRYVQQFSDRFTPSARRQRNREFTEDDIHVLARIRDLASQGHRFNQIGSMLGEVVEQPAPEPEELPPQTALMIIKGIIQKQDDQADQIAALRAQLAQLAQELQDQRRPWWSRLRRKG